MHYRDHLSLFDSRTNLFAQNDTRTMPSTMATKAAELHQRVLMDFKPAMSAIVHAVSDILSYSQDSNNGFSKSPSLYHVQNQPKKKEDKTSDCLAYLK